MISLFTPLLLSLLFKVNNASQPLFFSPKTLWQVTVYAVDETNGLSPFYKYERLWTKQIKGLVLNGEEEMALELLKKIIHLEQRWRERLCFRVFGKETCTNHSKHAVPFFIWGKKMIFKLNKNPTKEIVERIKRTIQFARLKKFN